MFDQLNVKLFLHLEQHLDRFAVMRTEKKEELDAWKHGNPSNPKKRPKGQTRPVHQPTT